MEVKTSSLQLKDFLESNKGKTYTTGLITLIVVVLMVVFAIVPANLSITDKIVQNESKREYLENLTAKEGNLKTLVQQEIDYAEEINKLQLYLSQEVNDEWVLANIDAIATNNGAKVINSEFKDPDIATDPEIAANLAEVLQVEFSVTIQGNLPNFQAVLTQLERFPTGITIKGMAYNNNSIEINGLDENDGRYLMVLNLIYYKWI